MTHLHSFLLCLLQVGNEGGELVLYRGKLRLQRVLRLQTSINERERVGGSGSTARQQYVKSELFGSNARDAILTADSIHRKALIGLYLQ